MKCDSEIQKDLFQNIVVTGGNTLFKGFLERIEMELTSLLPSSIPFQVIGLPNRKESVWLGGSILASLPSFPEMCLYKHEYDEWGPMIASSKFL